MLFTRFKRPPDSKSIPLAVWAFMIFSNSSVKIGINLSAIDIIIAISCTGTPILFKNPSDLSSPSVSSFGVVVNVSKDVPNTSMIRRLPR